MARPNEERAPTSERPEAQVETAPEAQPAGVFWPFAIVGSIVIAVCLASIAAQRSDEWLDNTNSIQLTLNDRYVERIVVYREVGHKNAHIEAISINGNLRFDCGVPDDDNPTVACDRPVTLTKEPAG